MQQSSQWNSIHLVPKQDLRAAFSPDVSADLFPPLSLPSVQPGLTIASEYLSTYKASIKEAHLTLLNPVTVLRELFELLEAYSPIWYTDENHNRAVAALNLSLR